MSTTRVFDNVENKHSLYRKEDYMKMFYEFLEQHTKNIVHIEEKKHVSINKRRTKIISRCKTMLHVWKKILKDTHREKTP